MDRIFYSLKKQTGDSTEVIIKIKRWDFRTVMPNAEVQDFQKMLLSLTDEVTT